MYISIPETKLKNFVSMSVELKRKFTIEHHEKSMSPPEIFKLGKKFENQLNVDKKKD